MLIKKFNKLVKLCSATQQDLLTDLTHLYIFILSTASTASGIPLAMIRTSDERDLTIQRAFEMVKEILPPWAFFGNGPSTGPEVFMIDDMQLF